MVLVTKNVFAVQVLQVLQQYSKIQYNTVQYSTVNTVQYSTQYTIHNTLHRCHTIRKEDNAADSDGFNKVNYRDIMANIVQCVSQTLFTTLFFFLILNP